MSSWRCARLLEIVWDCLRLIIGLVDEFVAVREAPARLPCTIRLESHASASIVIRLHMIAYDCHTIAYDCI